MIATRKEKMNHQVMPYEWVRRIIEMEPANHAAHIRLGDIALRSGRLDEARAAYSLVITLGVTDTAVRLRARKFAHESFILWMSID